MTGQQRRLVVVSGAPGSGKTSLAVPLAAQLGFALLGKDRIKEALHDGLGAPAPVDLAWSQRLGAAAMELLWALAADAPVVVIEANFRPPGSRPPRSTSRPWRPVCRRSWTTTHNPNCPPEADWRRGQKRRDAWDGR